MRQCATVSSAVWLGSVGVPLSYKSRQCKHTHTRMQTHFDVLPPLPSSVQSADVRISDWKLLSANSSKRRNEWLVGALDRSEAADSPSLRGPRCRGPGKGRPTALAVPDDGGEAPDKRRPRGRMREGPVEDKHALHCGTSRRITNKWINAEVI